MRGHDRPHPLLVRRLAPAKGARRAHQPLEDLRIVGGVQRDQSHALEHTPVHPFDDRVLHFLVCLVSPPNQYICPLEDGLAQAVLRFVERRGADDEVGVGAQRRSERLMDAVGINRANLGVLPLVTVFAPDGDVDGCGRLRVHGRWWGFHQILARFSGGRHMPSPSLMPKAVKKASTFTSGPVARRKPGACGPVVTCSFSRLSRNFVRHCCAQERKKRCSAMKPSIFLGLGFPSSERWKASNAIETPPRSAMFSPSASSPCTNTPGSTS